MSAALQSAEGNGKDESGCLLATPRRLSPALSGSEGRPDLGKSQSTSDL